MRTPRPTVTPPKKGRDGHSRRARGGKLNRNGFALHFHTHGGKASAFHVRDRRSDRGLQRVCGSLKQQLHAIGVPADRSVRASGIAERISVLYQQLATIDGADVEATPETLAPMREIVEQFAEEVINEATGWKAMLRDKNVPLT